MPVRPSMTYSLSVADTARRLGISSERVRQLDSVLNPIRVGSTRVRFYEPATVDAFARVREAKRAG